MSPSLATYLADYHLPPTTIDQLEQLLLKFQEINAHTNLSSFNDADTIAVKHLYDSLALWRHPDLFTGAAALDMGTGGGFPGLPLAICQPQPRWTLVDATSKKVAAVQTMIDSLHLTHVTTVWGRLETFGTQPRWRQQFDLITARALSALPTLWQYAAPLLRPGGHLVAYKTDATEAEQTAPEALKYGLSLTAIHPYTLPGDAGQRALFVYTKRLTVHAKPPSLKV